MIMEVNGTVIHLKARHDINLLYLLAKFEQKKTKHKLVRQNKSNNDSLKGFKGFRAKLLYKNDPLFLSRKLSNIQPRDEDWMNSSIMVKSIKFTPIKNQVKTPQKVKNEVMPFLKTNNRLQHRRSPTDAAIFKSTDRYNLHVNSTSGIMKERPSSKLKPLNLKNRVAIIPDKVPFKDAYKNKVWCSQAKPYFDKHWEKFMRYSNAIDVILPEDLSFKYKYYIGRGNNSKLIKKLLQDRGYWVSVSEPCDAHFVWTQGKDKVFLASLAVQERQVICDLMMFKTSLLCPIKFKCPDLKLRPVSYEGCGYDIISESPSYIALKSNGLVYSASTKMHNKLECNFHLSNKKGLYENMVAYYSAIGIDPFTKVPITFHIKQGVKDEEFVKFEQFFLKSVKESKKRPLWIVKPGENSNRGNGITVCDMLEQIKDELRNDLHPTTGEKRTFVIQKYIEKPFLIHKRKFDIRCYGMMTSINGIIQGYFYEDGYLRTTSKEYSTSDISNPYVHLTNDAVQKYSDDYGKYENGNKLSYRDFQRYLDFHCSEIKVNFYERILPQIKEMIRDTMKAVFLKIDPQRRAHTMEVYGYDILIDANLKPWLLEVNTNPCLELSAPYLSLIIPAMIDNAFRISLDTMFPDPSRKPTDSFSINKFELIFHELVDGTNLFNELSQKGSARLIMEEEGSVISDTEDIHNSDEETNN